MLRVHRDAPFPASVTKGIDYGLVDAVMIGADIHGWASQIADDRALDPVAMTRLTAARDDLRASIDAFPVEARPYYETLVDIASAALGD